MSFYQNLFDEYEGFWSIGSYGDYGPGKGLPLTFKVPGNKNRGEVMVAWNSEPYDLSGDDDLTFNFAFDNEFKNIASFTVAVAGATAASTLASEIRDILNANSSFSAWFTAGVDANAKGSQVNRLYVRQKRPASGFRTYISNSGAELALKFNKFGGVADIPSYFDKDTIANRFNTTEANNKLIRLSHAISGNTVANPTVVTSTAHGLTNGDVIYIVGSNSTPTIDGPRTVTVTGTDTFTIPVNVTTAGTTGEWLSEVEHQIVTDAGIDYSTMLPDWGHLRGRTTNFNFIQATYDGSNRVVTKLIYPAGAVAGQMAKRILYTYTGASTVPTTQMELPHVLTAADLITP